MSMNGVTSTWGPQGLVADRALSVRMADAARQWFTGEIRLSDLRAVAGTLPRRSHISMVVNNECNLKCKHCFLQLPGLSRERLTSEEWKQVLESSISENIGQYVVAGKEPLVGKTGPEVIAWLGALRAQRPCIRTGVVTNGTLIHKHSDLLKVAALSHMDISIDGCETDHDAIRGPGAFAKLRSNVELAASLMGERLFVTMTLQQQNLRRIDEALLAFSSMGVRSVGISAFEQLPYNDDALALSPADLRAFFGDLHRIERLDLPQGMFIQTDATVAEPLALLAFMESPWFDLDTMQIDGTGFMYFRHHLANGVTLSFRVLPWPMDLTSSVRITADGELVSVEDARHPRTHHANSLANVRDYGFDFGAAFRAASKHPRFALQDARYEAELAPLVRAAYRRQQNESQSTRVTRAA